MDDSKVSSTTPLVFVSYSHDSPQHKQWVAEFATRLRKEGGADVILDQWDTEHGDDLPKFMEKSVRDADRVLMICTTAYVMKANDGRGGVGYEAMVVTAELVKDLGKAKFIPVIPPENVNALVPTCVSTRKFVDLRDPDDAAQGFDALVESLHHLVGCRKPPVSLAARFHVAEDVAPLQEEIARSASNELQDPLDFHARAVSIIRGGDYLAWQEFVRYTRTTCRTKLMTFRHEKEANATISNINDATEIAIEAASLYSPLMAIALAGVESGSERFRNQTGVLSDILNPGGWIRGGLVVLVELPNALAYIYQALNGAMCVQSHQFDLAAALAQSPLVLESRDEVAPLFTVRSIIGWIDSLGRNMSDCTRVLLALPERWDWLKALFDDQDNFAACISCYYILLLTIEFIALCKSGALVTNRDALDVHVPPVFWLTRWEVPPKALQKILNDRQQVRALWEQEGVSGEQVANAWDAYYSAMARSEMAFRFNMERGMHLLRNPIRQLL